MPHDHPSAHSNLARLQTRSHELIASHSRTVWLGDREGSITREGDGLFIHETRMLSRFLWHINRELATAAASNVAQNSLVVYAIAHPQRSLKAYRGRTGGPLPAREATGETIELRTVTVLSDGFQQSATITNFTIQKQPIVVELEIEADFADQQEVDSGKRTQKGRQERSLKQTDEAIELNWRYRAEHRDHSIDRSVRIRVEGLPQEARWRRHAGRLQFRLELAPGASHRLLVTVSAQVETTPLEPYLDVRRPAELSDAQSEYLASTTRIEPEGMAGTLERAVERARHDLAALRIYDLDRGDVTLPAWVPAAGIPDYVATFGRDVLTTAWETALFGPEIMRGALRVLEEMQADENNPWRDARPGKMLHEAHTGPLSALNYTPKGRYYGSFNTSPFYIIVLSEYFHWTGDRDATLRHLPAARAALEWMDRYGHPGPPHFYAFQTRSKQGVKNQGWKDSGDALVYPDGRIVPDPIAGCPIQGFAYEAKLRMGELLWLAGERLEAARVLRQAHELKKRFNDAFWMPEENYFAMALDGRGRQVRSIGSDPGDALATGIVAAERAEAVVERLFSPELFSGWGVRTLSDRHISFNPYSYHRGSVWPSENAAIGVGLRRYGFNHHLGRLLHAQLRLGERFQFLRLPEVVCGHAESNEQPFPPIYPKACSPQAWSSGMPPIFLQMILGLYPYAPFETLFLDPQLPDWLPQLRLHGLRVGQASVDLRFWRTEDGSSSYEVEAMRGKLRLVKQPSPWSIFTTPAERVEDLVESWRAA